MKIEGAVALVTGGASGLGEATIRRLAGAGAKAVIVDRDAKKGEALAKELGERVVFQPTDVTAEADVRAAVERAASLGPLRVAVSCAGVGWAARTVDKSGAPHDLELEFFGWPDLVDVLRYVFLHRHALCCRGQI